MIEELAQLVPAKWCEELVARCLVEDGLEKGDVTSLSIVDPKTVGSFEVNARQQGVVAGLHVFVRLCFDV